MADTEENWVTINGTHILLKGGESPKDAIERKFRGGKGNGATTQSTKTNTPLKSTPAGKPISRSRGDFATKNAEDNEIYSSDEKTNIEEYRSYNGEKYKVINQNAREGKITTEIKHMDSAIDKSPAIPKGTKLYRGLSASQAESLSNVKIGDSFNQGGYQSYSLDKNMANNFAQSTTKSWSKTFLMIEGDNSLKGIYIGAKEKEVLLPRGKTYIITGRTTEKEKGTKWKTHIITVKVG